MNRALTIAVCWGIFAGNVFYYLLIPRFLEPAGSAHGWRPIFEDTYTAWLAIAIVYFAHFFSRKRELRKTWP